MNSRGQLAFIMIPIVALVLAGMALYTFIGFRGDFSLNNEAILGVAGKSQFSYNYVVETCKGTGQAAIVSGEDAKQKFKSLAQAGLGTEKYNFDGLGNFYDKIGKGDFTFANSGENYVLDIRGLKLVSSNGYNSITTTFEMKMTFDGQGNFAGLENLPQNALS